MYGITKNFNFVFVFSKLLICIDYGYLIMNSTIKMSYEFNKKLEFKNFKSSPYFPIKSFNTKYKHTNDFQKIKK